MPRISMLSVHKFIKKLFILYILEHDDALNVWITQIF